jgi:hypothetical protein
VCVTVRFHGICENRDTKYFSNEFSPHRHKIGCSKVGIYITFSKYRCIRQIQTAYFVPMGLDSFQKYFVSLKLNLVSKHSFWEIQKRRHETNFKKQNKKSFRQFLSKILNIFEIESSLKTHFFGSSYFVEFDNLQKRVFGD